MFDGGDSTPTVPDRLSMRESADKKEVPLSAKGSSGHNQEQPWNWLYSPRYSSFISLPDGYGIMVSKLDRGLKAHSLPPVQRAESNRKL